jgi:hypothetical protein
MAAIAATIAAVTAVVGTAISVKAQADSAEETNKLNAATSFEQRQSSTRKRIRERRIIEGRLRNQAEQVGAGGGSGEAGALSSIASQFATSTSADVFAGQQAQKAGAIQSKLAKKQGVGQLIKAGGSAAAAGVVLYNEYKT